MNNPSYGMQIEKMRSRNQFRTITISAMPAEGKLASEVMSLARPKLKELQQTLPAGYRLEVGGEEEEQVKGFIDLTIVLLISGTAIFLALVCQFKNAIKPFIVFAAVPFGMVGALAALWTMGAPFGFMAFAGIVSLVGVIVSHIIVLFDFIEEKHAEGAAGASDLFVLRPRLETGEVGKRQDGANSERSLAGCCASGC